MTATKKVHWSKKPKMWIEDRKLYISVVFTYHLPSIKSLISQRSLLYDHIFVGGPAIDMMPTFIESTDSVTIGGVCSGALQRHNPLATRTTTGCIRKCKFCAIGSGLIETGGLRELSDFKKNPVIIDNNFLASSTSHFDRVIDMLIPFGWADFNQGLDARLLTPYHAARIAEIKTPTVRLALDHSSYTSQWDDAFEMLRSAGIAKNRIMTYVLAGYKDSPEDAWRRAEYVESHGALALPMWFHPLDALIQNKVYDFQEKNGWNDYERKRIMGWYYRHRGERYDIETGGVR